MSQELSYDEYREKVKKLNGANLILVNENNEILNFRSKYGERKRMLPGGGIERNELPAHASCAELEEECSLIVEPEDLALLGVLAQRVVGVPEITGFVFLYFAKKYTGQLKETEEAADLKFTSPEEIFKNRSDFGLGYLKMIAHYLKWKQFQTPICGRLADPVEVHINGEWIQV